MNKTISYPTLDQIESALFIQPHPDDNEIGAGGTIALLRKSGAKIYGLTVTKGEGGSPEPTITPKEITEIRKSEANDAMKILDIINLGNLDYDEVSSINHDELVKDIVTVLRSIKVDAVFTVDPKLKDELHPTHIQVGNAVSEAFMRCGLAYFPADNKIHKDAYTLKILGYYMTNRATTVVNISDVIDIKMSSVKAHKSQIDEALLEAIYSLAEVNALGFDFKYAEPLRLLDPLHTHSFSIPDKLLNSEPVSVYPPKRST